MGVMADATTERERKRWQIHAALNDDPGGLTHPIWAELGKEPQAPISAEERWLIDQSVHIKDDAEAAAFVRTKVWDRVCDADGHRYWVKLWTLTPEQRIAEQNARRQSALDELARGSRES